MGAIRRRHRPNRTKTIESAVLHIVWPERSEKTPANAHTGPKTTRTTFSKNDGSKIQDKIGMGFYLKNRVFGFSVSVWRRRCWPCQQLFRLSPAPPPRESGRKYACAAAGELRSRGTAAAPPHPARSRRSAAAWASVFLVSSWCVSAVLCACTWRCVCVRWCEGTGV